MLQVEPLAPVVFVCATGADDIVSEANQHEDILQFDFPDSYHNLSLKMMAIYGYVLGEIASVEDIIVTNDDTIVNATALAQGSSFILSREAARVLLENICKTPFVHLDDILMGKLWA
ncbi:hypothetical protein ANCCEY_02201 [Ancylostoma ceylanicum]|uniref:Hexosyltransferase n=1 Tax=Ancylostoma ceylanicum TaxID=53326 RepID=A0A0D6MCC7_9BILA|nr:hypothetical protein ANCCEY_02201 [Ancylostoma ceylanicum]